MEKYIYDKNNGLWYELQGDYYIPCLSLDEANSKPIGMWGRQYLRYIKDYRSLMLSALVLSSKLHSYLEEVDCRATEILELLVRKMAQQHGITEQMKAQDQMVWVGAMNNIRNSAKEIILQELIYGESAV